MCTRAAHALLGKTITGCQGGTTVLIYHSSPSLFLEPVGMEFGELGEFLSGTGSGQEQSARKDAVAG